MIITLGDIRRRDRRLPSPRQMVGTYRQIGSSGQLLNHEVYFTETDPNRTFQEQVTWDELHPGPPYRKDGPLLSYKLTRPYYQVAGNTDRKVFTGPKAHYHYKGGFSPLNWDLSGSGMDFNSLSSESAASGESYGPEAWNKARPKIEKADVAVFTGEAREIPGMIQGTAKFFRDHWKSMGGDMKSPVMQPRRVADEFLNQQFGWLPFVGDLGKFHDTFVNTDRYLSQIERDNGQWVKRRRVLFQNLSAPNNYKWTAAPWVVPYSDISHMLQPRVVNGVTCRGYTQWIHQSFDSVWFSAYFRYYLSQFDRGKKWYDTSYGKVQRLLALYGARVSPATLWNLTPWTWLADWVSNAGDNIDNITAATYDNLVARNACIMRRRQNAWTLDARLFFRDGDHAVSFTAISESKSRKTASPFGFDLTWNSFSLRQLAILGALGISRFS